MTTNEPQPDGLSFLFRAAPIDLETLEARPASVTGQAWIYVTRAEIHPQLCVFRKVYNDANPFFVVYDHPPVAVRARDTPLPVFSAEYHAALAANASRAQPRAYLRRLENQYPCRIQFWRLVILAAIVGVLMVISGLAKWDQKLMLIGGSMGGPAIVIVSIVHMLCAIHDRKQQQQLAAIKKQQLELMQRAVDLLNGSCVGYRWRVHDAADDCNVQLFLDILDPDRLARLAPPAGPPANAKETTEPLVSLPLEAMYPTGADGMQIEEGWPTVVDAAPGDTAVDITPCAENDKVVVVQHAIQHSE